MKQLRPLQPLALVFFLLFSLAFQCRSGRKDNPPPARGVLTEDIVKAQITEFEESFVGTGGVTSVSLTFESIRIGGSQAPSYQDKIDGITSAEYYPVRVKYTRVRKQTDEDLTRNFDQLYKFFIDANGQWRHVHG